MSCWIYVRVLSGTPGTNLPGDPQSPPPLSDSDVKFGRTRSIAAREGTYRGDGGITAFCVKFPTEVVAHAVEGLLVDRLTPMRSRSIGGQHREYLDMHKVAAAFGQTFAAGSAQSRLEIARLLMRCALTQLRLVRPDGATAIAETDLVPWATVRASSMASSMASSNGGFLVPSGQPHGSGGPDQATARVGPHIEQRAWKGALERSHPCTMSDVQGRKICVSLGRL